MVKLALLVKLGGLLALAAMAAAPGAARAAPPAFSADVTVTLSGEEAEQLKALAAAAGQPFEARVKARLFVSGVKLRLEFLSGPQRGVVISDGASGKSWFVQPAEKSYLELGAGEDEAGGAELARYLEKGGDVCTLSPAAVSCKRTGQDKVGGRACQLYEIVEKEGDGKQVLCVDEKLHFPIRMVEGSSTTEITKVVEGPQPASLFTVPAGWKKKAAPGE
jgi:hypothetical protein